MVIPFPATGNTGRGADVGGEWLGVKMSTVQAEEPVRQSASISRNR